MDNFCIPGSVVVGVDGSPGSDIAVEWAAAHAAAQGRPLAVVHGTGLPVVTDFAIDLAETGRDLRMAGRRVTDAALRLAQHVSGDLRISVQLAVEDPRTLLMRTASDASLLVLGARGHGVVVGLLLGSVSGALSAHAPCPVVVARELPEAEDSVVLPVVVGVDGTDASSGAIGLAFETASWESRPLHVVHALGDPLAYPYYDVLSEGQRHGVRADCELRVAEALAGYAEKFPDVHTSTTLVMDSAAHALRVASEDASLVVVGTRGRGPVTRRLLGSVSRSVVERARCTVAVVPGGAS